MFLKNDRFLKSLVTCCACVCGIITLGIFWFLLAESFPLLKKVGLTAFFTDASWAPTAGQFHFVPMLVGTFWAMVGSVMIATPLGLGVAILIRFYAPAPISKTLRSIVWLLAGIPSVVYGFWGLVKISPLINKFQPPGLCLAAGILILTIMILPTITLLAEAALANVSASYILGAQALGVDTWPMVRRVLIPAAKSGLMTAVILEVGRAIGETMAVIMVMGNTIQIPKSLFDPARTLTANIALEMAYAVGDHRRALFVTGLTLLGMITLLVILAEKFSRSKVMG